MQFKLIAGIVAFIASVRATPQPVEVGHSISIALHSDGSAPFHETIDSPGASYISVHFTTLSLPANSTFEVACRDGLKKLTYTTTQNDFYTESMPCSTVELKYSSSSYSKHDKNIIEIDQYVSGINGLPSSGVQETICSISDESRPAICFNKTEPSKFAASRSVARLLITGKVLCTGWLFGSEGHLITNSHCINSETRAKNTQVEFNALCPSCKDPQNKVESGCPGDIVATSTKLIAWDELNDFALVQLDNLKPNANLQQYAYLQARDAPVQVDEPIWTSHHAAGWPKRLTLTNNGDIPKVLTLDKQSCMDNFRNTKDTIGHFLDTQGGSSGAPIMSTNDNTVIALHNCGLCDNTGNSNGGIKMSNIIKFLKDKNVLPKDSVAPSNSPAPTTDSPTSSPTTAPSSVPSVTPTPVPTTSLPAPTTSIAPTSTPKSDYIGLCTFENQGVYEWYGLIYADKIDSSPNAQFQYDAASGAIAVHHQCLDAYSDSNGFHLHTWPCDANNKNQRWIIESNRVRHLTHNICISTTRSSPKLLTVATCNSQDTRQIISTKCTGPVKSYIKLRLAGTSTFLSEWNSGLYANGEVHNLNELFEINSSTQQIKVASNGQCLDAYQVNDRSYSLHTYSCDENNSNQKWIIAHGTIKHAHHPNLCLDVDANSHKAQVWTCFESNSNQLFEFVDN
ncbi:hypothetical protein THRCLA_01623 [Thraustotheca clavata]|uniref:Secreted protein n=1 Tax=Thraustotheca clavata TaxID=74557 RepID=A0A0A7CLU3_9STRA|nr:secreted protein [Thraustotheca clavata]OQS06336.1 hypothetical protein THRCLA_01623 [Thraustotheca clavata]